MDDQGMGVVPCAMATDGPTPPPCASDIYRDGAEVLVVAGVASNAMEGWVKRVAEASGQRVDWHFVGGRAVVKALGDLGRVRQALAELQSELYRTAPRAQTAFPERLGLAIVAEPPGPEPVTAATIRSGAVTAANLRAEPPRPEPVTAATIRLRPGC